MIPVSPLVIATVFINYLFPDAVSPPRDVEAYTIAGLNFLRFAEDGVCARDYLLVNGLRYVGIAAAHLIASARIGAKDILQQVGS